MADQNRTQVVFCATGFNTTKPGGHFINESNYGDDLSRLLLASLARRGVATDSEPQQEDFGWFFGFDAGGVEHCFVVAHAPAAETDDRWVGWVERHVGLLSSLIGGRNRGIRPEAIALIDDVLREFATDLTWSRRGAP